MLVNVNFSARKSSLSYAGQHVASFRSSVFLATYFPRVVEGLTNLLDSVAPSVSELRVSHQQDKTTKPPLTVSMLLTLPSATQTELFPVDLQGSRIFLLNRFKSAWIGVKLNAYPYPSPLGPHFIQFLEDNFQVIEDEARFCARLPETWQHTAEEVGHH